MEDTNINSEDTTTPEVPEIPVVKRGKGFGFNKEGINRNGRPKGSRNKSSLLKSQLQIDNNTEYAVELLEALMRNDKEFLGLRKSDDVPLTVRAKAAESVLNKAIGNQKDKLLDNDSNDKNIETTSATPIFSTRAVPILKKV